MPNYSSMLKKAKALGNIAKRAYEGMGGYKASNLRSIDNAVKAIKAGEYRRALDLRTTLTAAMRPSKTKAATKRAVERVRDFGENLIRPYGESFFKRGQKPLVMPRAIHEYRKAVGRYEPSGSHQIMQRAKGLEPNVNEMLKMAREAKKKLGKTYQAGKDVLQSNFGPMQNKGMSHKRISAQQKKWQSVMGKIDEFNPKLQRAMYELSKRGLLPAAAAGAGVAASRKSKAQGYAMGGMVKRSRKGC